MEKMKLCKLQEDMAKTVVNHSYFALDDIGPVIAQLLGLIYDEEYFYSNEICDKEFGFRHAKIVDAKGYLVVDFGKYVNTAYPTYSFYSIKDAVVKYNKVCNAVLVKNFIDYLINYKLNNNLLYLDKGEIKHLEKRFIRKNRLLYLKSCYELYKESSDFFVVNRFYLKSRR